MNHRIRIARGTHNAIINNASISLPAGQPLYDRSRKYLYIGDGAGTISSRNTIITNKLEGYQNESDTSSSPSYFGFMNTTTLYLDDSDREQSVLGNTLLFKASNGIRGLSSDNHSPFYMILGEENTSIINFKGQTEIEGSARVNGLFYITGGVDITSTSQGNNDVSIETAGKIYIDNAGASSNDKGICIGSDLLPDPQKVQVNIGASTNAFDNIYSDALYIDKIHSKTSDYIEIDTKLSGVRYSDGSRGYLIIDTPVRLLSSWTLQGKCDKAYQINYTSSAPTESPDSGWLEFYVGNTLPATRYDRVVYLITQSN